MLTVGPYTDQWRDYRRRYRRIFIWAAVPLAFVPFVNLHNQSKATRGLIALIGLIVWVSGLWYWSLGTRYFRCPRCRELFEGQNPGRNFRATCANCGLRKYADG